MTLACETRLPAEVAQALAGFPAGQASRALAVLERLAETRERACGRPAAWTGSGLTGDGFPLELAFTTTAPDLRWTFDPAPPGATRTQRVAAALRALQRLGAPPEPQVLEVALAPQALDAALEPQAREAALARQRADASGGPADAFGAWIGGRHDGEADRYKLYVDLPEGAAASEALRSLGLPRPRLPDASAVVRMLGIGPEPGRAEVYFRTRSSLASLPRLLEPAGAADAASLVADSIAQAWGHSLRDRLPGGSFGFSYACGTGSGPPTVTLFFVARTLWGGDGRIRARMLACLEQAGLPQGPYAQASLAVAQGVGACTRHGLVGLTPAGGRVHWSVGLRPASGPW